MKLKKLELNAAKTQATATSASRRVKVLVQKAREAGENAREARVKFKQARKESRRARKAARRVRKDLVKAQKELAKATAVANKARAAVARARGKNAEKQTPKKKAGKTSRFRSRTTSVKAIRKPRAPGAPRVKAGRVASASGPRLAAASTRDNTPNDPEGGDTQSFEGKPSTDFPTMGGSSNSRGGDPVE